MQQSNTITVIKLASSCKLLPIILTFFVGLTLSLSLFFIINHWESKNQRIEFESIASSYASAIESHFSQSIGALSFIADYFNNSTLVTREEFVFFTQSALVRYPGIQAFSWNPLVTHAERPHYEKNVRAQGFAHFNFMEKSAQGTLIIAAERQEYVIVYYISPLATNQAAFGLDIAFNATRRAAINKVFTSGKITVTGRITLVQETEKQFGVLIFIPVYQQNVSLKSSADRQKYRKGLVVQVLRIGDSLETALTNYSNDTLDIYLFDDSAAKDQQFLYFKPAGKQGVHQQPDLSSIQQDSLEQGLYWQKSFDLAGRQWRLIFKPATLYHDSQYKFKPWLVAIGTLFLTFLLTHYLLRKLSYTYEIEQRIRSQLKTTQQLETKITEVNIAHNERNKAQQALLTLNIKLEERVDQRTQELQQKNGMLHQTLTRLNDAQGQLIEAEKMAALGRLVAGIAHEVNTPLGIAVTGISHLEQLVHQLIAQKEAGTLSQIKFDEFCTSIQHSIDLVQKNMRRGADLIQDFKLVAVDQTSGEQRIFNVKDYLHEIVASLKPNLAKLNHQVRITCKSDIEINSYPGLCYQIISNLILNSIIHGFGTTTHGQIEIIVTLTNNQLELIYSDNGTGMDNETVERIFEPFYTTKRGQGGSGLGAHLVYNQVVHQLGGSIHCRSSLGQGCTFTLSFPLKDQE